MTLQAMRFLILSLLAFFLLTNTLISALNYQDVPMTENKIEEPTTKIAAMIYKAQNRVGGSMARINVWQPSIERDSIAYSSAHMRIMAISDENFEAIEAGWHVYPKHYNKDERTKFYVSWTVKNNSYQKTRYYERGGGGFFAYYHIPETMRPGTTIHPVSSYEGDQREMTLTIYKNNETGNWWLNRDGRKVGYWKSELFTNLKNGGTHVEWGGVVSYERSHDGKTHAPIQMGSGHFPREGYGKASYFDYLKILNSDIGSTWTAVPPDRLEPEVTDSQSYDLQFRPHGIYSEEIAPGFYYGGGGSPP